MNIYRKEIQRKVAGLSAELDSSALAQQAAATSLPSDNIINT